jgi:O-antigen/teichoic acid export membrane protein
MAISNFGAAFEAIVMGGHRIDLTRTFNMFTTAGEAVAVVALLSMGYGLFAMAAVMAVSELVNLGCCYVASRRVVPEIRISLRHFSPSAFRELFRFAFSYQFVNILEVLYNLLLPVTILKFFGTEIAGIYAVVSRLAGAAQMGPDAMILPLLSAGTMVLSSGSVEKMRRFVNKSFKLTLALSSAPLAFVAVFGAPMIMAWTGRGDPEFRIALPFVCLAGLFQCISRLQLILYRATGNALHDIIRQAFRLGILFMLAGAGALIGFYGVLAALAVTEGVGVIYMCFALATPLRFLRLRDLVSDALRLTTAGAIIIAAGLSASAVRVPWALAGREAAIMKVVAGTLGCAIAVWPALALTGSTSPDERRTIRSLFLAWKEAPALATE